MLNAIILVFVGGSVGALTRELLMLSVPNLSDGFPMAIFVANIVASFLLGLITGLHNRQAVSDDVNALVGTGIMGGLSTFSSFAYGVVVLMGVSAASAGVAAIYVIVSLIVGFVAVVVGTKIGELRLA